MNQTAMLLTDNIDTLHNGGSGKEQPDVESTVLCLIQ